MKIALAQIATIAGDFEVTAKRMEGFAERAQAEGASLIVFPYASLTGPQAVDEADLDAYASDATDTLQHLAEALPIAAIVPVVREAAGEVQAEAFLLEDGAVTPLRMSALASSVGAISREASLDPLADMPAPDLPEFEFGGVRLGIAFTLDDLDDYRDYDFNIDVCLFLPSEGFVLGDPDAALSQALGENRYPDDAQQMGAWIACADSVGGYGSTVFAGAGFVLGPKGELVQAAPLLEETLMVFDTDAEAPAAGSGGVMVPSEGPDYRTLWQVLVRGLADLVREGPHEKVALMLDGSLASGLLAVLATDALGPLRVEALVAGGDAEAQELAGRLHLDFRTPDFRLPVPQPGAWASGSAELEQTIQEAFLAELARQSDALLLVADDKTGLAVGEGQMSHLRGAWAPFGDVFRSDLAALARERNRISPVIDEACISRIEVPAIFAIGKAAATDAGRLQALDEILSARIEDAASFSEAFALGYDPGFTKAVLHRLHEEAPGRLFLPPCFAVSLRMLSELASPAGLAWCDHERTDGEQYDYEDIVKQLEDIIRGGGRHEPSPPDQQALRDAFELIRDLSSSPDASEGEGGTPEGGSYTVRPGFPSWENPFSEN